MGRKKAKDLTAGVPAATDLFVFNPADGSTASKKIATSALLAALMTIADQAFSASDFAGTASLVWTVGSGDVATFRYAIAGNLMGIWFKINTSTLSGSETGAGLTIKIPGGRLPAKTFTTVAEWSGPFGINELVKVTVTAGSNLLTVQRFGTGEFVLDTDSHGFSGFVLLEVA